MSCLEHVGGNGLKEASLSGAFPLAVRPHAGAGVETLATTTRRSSAPGFAPMRGRELKLGMSRSGRLRRRVRPHAGAGVETAGYSDMPVEVPWFAPMRGRELKPVFC
jgi:hypothetical protein